MKKKFFLTKYVTFFIVLFTSLCMGSDGIDNYENSSFNYRISVPNSWKRVALNLENKHFMYVSIDKNTEIKVSAFKSSEKDLESILHKKEWDLRGMDSRLRKIIETEYMEIKKDVTGKLLVYEYNSNKENHLKRTLATKHNEIIYIIECTSPVRSFYKYEDVFTNAFASFSNDYIETELEDANLIEDKSDLESEEPDLEDIDIDKKKETESKEDEDEPEDLI